jgi:hypothetical protein
MSEDGSADCGDEITQTYRINCNQYCDIVDFSIGGYVTGNIGTQIVEKFCLPTSSGYACSAKKKYQR